MDFATGGGRNQQVALYRHNFAACEGLSPRQADNSAMLPLESRNIIQVEAALAVNPALGIADRHNAGTGGLEAACCRCRNIAKTLNGNGGNDTLIGG